MTVQTPQAPRAPHSAAHAGHASGNKPVAADAGTGNTLGSFSALLGDLSDSAEVDEVTLPDDPAFAEAQEFIKKRPLDQLDNAQAAITMIAVGLPIALTPVPAEPALATQLVSAQAGVARPAGLRGKAARVEDFSDTVLMGADALQSRSVTEGTDPDAVVARQIDALLGARSRQGVPALSQSQINLREAQQHAAVEIMAPPATTDVAAIKLASMPAESLAQVVDRQPGKSAVSLMGSGFEGAWTATGGSTSGLDSTYAVAQASAVVPDTQLAETVSYWVTRGVQTAELTLDGLGSEPVQVQISLDGDQASIDFRSNQPEVRQVLESAAGQLKSLLSGEGLQLVGWSVGSSGQGQSNGGAPTHKSPVRQVSVQAAPTVVTPVHRPLGTGVGQALDLFV